ncbi:MAG: M20/M25/M40 family metallo-hydrolase, partial [Chloroflexota bacterium]
EHIALLDASHPLTGPAVGSINTIRGGTGVNVIPERCEIEIDRRTVPGEDGAAVLAALERVLAGLRAADPGLDVAIVDALIHPVFDPAVGAAWAGIVGDVVRAAGHDATPKGVGYGTDASAFAAAGIPAVVLGPGDIAQAHTADEWVAIDQLEGAVAIYRALMDRGPVGA